MNQQPDHFMDIGSVRPIQRGSTELLGCSSGSLDFNMIRSGDYEDSEPNNEFSLFTKDFVFDKQSDEASRSVPAHLLHQLDQILQTNH